MSATHAIVFRLPFINPRPTVAHRLVVTAALLCVAVAETAVAQERVVLQRLNGSIELDGPSDEAAWERIDPFPTTVYTPTFRAPPTERTEIRVAYDDQFLYMAARMYDSDRNGIRANTFYRDQYSGDDAISIVLDTYNDYETAVWFTANPTGARSDRTVSNDGEFGSGMPMNSDWNSHWEVATVVTDEGWFAEFRIPFSTLGFQEQDGHVTMGMILYRLIARKNERHTFPAIPPNWGLGFAKPSQAQRVELTGVHAAKPVYITPYALGGLTQTPAFTADPAPGLWQTNNDPTAEMGGDVKYSPTNNLALDLTINTDFAQVEVDDQQVNLTRFPLFFPEKRQFFQERASIFDFNVGGFADRLFHSRRIGLDDGEIVRIYGGARLVGRIGGADVGVLNMQTAPLGSRPSENMGVLRVRQKTFNSYSTIGGLLTTRIGIDGTSNVAYGLDAVTRPFGDEYVTLKWAHTFDELFPGASATDAGLFLATWERRNQDGLSYSADFVRAGPAYRPRLGFQSRVDFTFYGGNAQYKWFMGEGSPFRSFALSGNASTYQRNADRTSESGVVNPSMRFEFKSGSDVTIGATSNYESVRDSFPIADVYIRPGDYWFHQGNLHIMLSRGGLFRGDLNASAGTFYDGTRVGGGVTPTWSLSKYLELGGGYDINWLKFDERNESTTTHLAKLRVQLALDTHFSVNTFIQYNSAVDEMGINARLRYHFREGTDLWIVYNEGLNTETMDASGQRLPTSVGRSVMIKYTHTFIP